MQGVRTGNSDAGENMNLKDEVKKSCGISWGFIIIIFFIVISIALVAGFSIGFDSGQKAYSKFLDDNDIYCIDKSNEIFNQIGITFMNKSEIKEKLNARIPD
jgi:hypothetical protein